MVGHDDPWQIFKDNGEPLPGASASRAQFKKDRSLSFGASHVWVWRMQGNTAQVLVQRRAKDKRTWPGYLDVSAAGHIDAGETPIQAVAREAKEEIGLELNPEYLRFIFTMRTPLDGRELDFVYLYRLDEEIQFRFDDGEVEALMWYDIDAFVEMTGAPDAIKLVPQGEAYFALLLDNLRTAA